MNRNFWEPTAQILLTSNLVTFPAWAQVGTKSALVFSVSGDTEYVHDPIKDGRT